MKFLWLIHLILLAILLISFFRNRAMKRRQDDLVKDLQGQHFWRINLARPTFYKSWWRLLPFEAKGVLIDERAGLRVKGFWLRGNKAFESSFDKKSCDVEWLGNRNLKAGNLYWAQLTTPRGELLFCADTGMYALPSREALADIFRSVFPEHALNEQQTSDFALEKNPRSVRIVALFFALFLYSLLDTFVITHFELTDAQVALILTSPVTWLGTLAGLGVSLGLAYRYLLGGGVPARESGALSLFVGLALLGAAFPIAKRLDQVLASTPTQNHAYRVVKLAYLEPVDPALGLPSLRFPRAPEYWALFPTGSEYPIPFLRGPLGLWQLDHSAFDKPLVKFYETR